MFYSHTRNSVTIACNSITDQNLFTIKERYIYHENNCIQYKVILYVYWLMLAVGPDTLYIEDFRYVIPIY